MKNTQSNSKDFETVKRTFEKAYAAGGDFSAALMDLATATAYCVLKKCIDPQRNGTHARQTGQVDNGGQSPALVQIKREVYTDLQTLDNTRNAANAATGHALNADGDIVEVVTDPAALAVLNELAGETLGDGVDLVQTAAVAILEQAAEHAADGEKWLDKPYTARRLSKKVYIQAAESAAFKDVQTTAGQEIFRAVRRAIQNSRDVQTDPRNGYSYIEDFAEDGQGGLEVIYRRLGKYADLGGYDCNGNYTTSRQAVMDYATLVERLELTDRQAQIVRLRMQGKGYRAIGTYLGITHNAVINCLQKVQDKARELGYNL